MQVCNYNAGFVSVQRKAIETALAEACKGAPRKYERLLPQVEEALKNLELQNQVLWYALGVLSGEYTALANNGDYHNFVHKRRLMPADTYAPGIAALERSEAYWAAMLYNRKLHHQPGLKTESLWDIVEGK